MAHQDDMPQRDDKPQRDDTAQQETSRPDRTPTETVADLRSTVDELSARVSRLRGRPRNMATELFDRPGASGRLRGEARGMGRMVGDHPGLAALGLAAAAGAAVALSLYGSDPRRDRRRWS